jgi:radical SAM-linked protein
MDRILFEKTGKSIWMSHLDTMRLMQRAFRRAGVLLHHSQGYTPHAYVSMPLPLSVGMESVCEILEYELDGNLKVSAEELNRVMPQGIHVRKVYESAVKTKFLTQLQAEITLHYDHGVPKDACRRIAELFSAPQIMVTKRTKRGPEETDIKSLLYSATLSQKNDKLFIDCMVSAQNPPLNPLLLVQAIENQIPDLKPDHATCRRIEIYDDKGNPFR